MFPSANYFRDIPCPFFSRVACPRPHCHFKHVQVSSQSNLNTNTSSSSSSINIPPDANETLNKLINQLSSAAAASSTAATITPANSTPSIDMTSIFQNSILQSLTAAFANALNSNTLLATTATTNNNNNNEISEKIAQAISTQIQQQQQTQPAQPAQTTNTVEGVYEYRPTPLAELERRRRTQQYQPPILTTIKSEAIDFDSDDYAQATFSPPSSSPPPTSLVQSEPVEEQKPKISTAPKFQPITSNNIPKPAQPSITDDKHSWVTPPVRRKLSSSSSDHNDFDERKLLVAKKVTPPVKTQPLTKVINKPTATVKPNIIENTNKIITSTNPMNIRIPKKTTTTIPSKVRTMDIDLDKVPVTSTISVDTEANSNKKVTTTTTLKRSSNGTNEIPQKKARIVPTTKQNVPTIKKKIPATNGIIKTKTSDEDDELALFDQAFLSPKKPISAVPPTSVHQFVSRYTSLVNTQNDTNSTSVTRAETSIDGRRVAHQPKVHSTVNKPAPPLVFQPLVDPNSSVNKIPFKTRQEYLTFFLNELKKIATTSTTTIPVTTRAQTIEKEIFDKSTNKNSYLNLAAKHLRQLRSEEANNSNKNEIISPNKKTNAPRLVVSHSAMLTGGRTENLSFGIKKQKEIDMKTLTDNELYTLLLVYKASDRDLMENGYPAFSLDFPDKVLIKNKNPIYSSTTKILSSDPNTRTCCRCSKTYRITNEGEYVKREECIYHWGRLRTQRVAGQIEKVYSCCSSKTNSVGCAVSEYHVNESDDTQLLSGYVKTQPIRKQLTADEGYGIFALDCEMCYTINGLELVRVSVINHKLQSIYETLVKPHRQVLDYNTRWSGITERQLHDCNVTLEDVQRHLLKLFNNKSILIGHSLESDLKALKIVHDTVVDTSLVFPHAKGRPYKRALRTLMSEYLTKIIQEHAEGHDSIEDAVSCMELMLWKVKQDLKNTSSNR
ncbi:unnamed protein product [Adineta steineri]|uniref:C3H1-type domain-containing protein n=1 Tax=Adineta steineri TaxID=433720 RepID=A0A814QTY3_9BILA|nr:unnamed protein product [Adineta steineri]CAF1122748.1 unnamed protein product [Adineta steineri]CAF3552753.1 unnamed protein product [Adineta steineri]CAF3869672.1 unnamed protein product [Adineta steineri]